MATPQSYSFLAVTTSGQSVAFGFAANWLQVVSDSTASPVYFNASSSGAATTDYKILLGETLKIESMARVGVGGVSITTTSGGTANVRVFALAV